MSAFVRAEDTNARGGAVVNSIQALTAGLGVGVSGLVLSLGVGLVLETTDRDARLAASEDRSLREEIAAEEPEPRRVAGG